MAEDEPLSQEEYDLALEKAYRRGFQQALTLLATFYPNGVGHGELIRLANEHQIWRRELPASQIRDSAPSAFAGEVSPLERRLRQG